MNLMSVGFVLKDSLLMWQRMSENVLTGIEERSESSDKGEKEDGDNRSLHQLHLVSHQKQ